MDSAPTSVVELVKCLHVSEVLFVAYLVSQQVHFTGTQADVWICRALFVLYVVCTLLFDILPRQTRRQDSFFTGISIWSIVFYAFAIVSALWSISISYSLDATYINNILHILAIVVFISYQIRSKEDFDRFVLMITAVITITALVLCVKTPTSAWGSERVGLSIGLNANTAGIMMAVGCVLVLYLATNYREKWLAIFVLPLAMVALMSGSRKAFVLLILFAPGYLILRTRGFKAFCLSGVALISALFAYDFIMTDPDLYAVLGSRVEQAVISVTGGSSTDFSLIERSFYRKAAFEEFLLHPIAGIGMNGFMAYMELIGYSHVAYSHCNYTEMLCNFGLTGFVIYYSLFVSLLVYCLRHFRRLDDKLALSFVLLIGILFSDYGSVSYVDIIHFCYVVLAWGGVALHRRENASVIYG